MTDTKTDAPTLQERLRREVEMEDAAFGVTGYCPLNPDGPQAADALDESEAVIAALVDALRDVVGMLDDPTGNEHVRDMRGASVIARAAIAKAAARKRG